MAKPKVELTHSFNTWRLTTNSLSDLIGDVALAYNSDGTGEHLVTFTAPSDLIVAVNDLNTRKLKRTGDTMTGSLHFEQPTLTASDPFIDGHVTWNNAAVAFSGVHIDVTNTASHADSLLIDCRLSHTQKFGVDINGAVIQRLTGSYMARDIVSGARHVREYQDLNDASVQGLPASKIEWGFTWNAKWNGTAYVKDRSEVNDHAIMHRTDNSFKDQVWFSDGSILDSAISWVKRSEYDYYGNVAWIDLATTITRNFTVGANKLTVNATNGNTAAAGTLTVAGATTINNTFAVPSSATSLNSLTVSSTAAFNGAITSNAGLSLVGGTVTSSTPFLTATQTWNNVGVTFTGIDVNITNTASGPNSLLLNFKLAGVDKFGVTATGTVIQKLSGSNLARDVVSGSRHIREYQDLNDTNTQGLGAAYNEWGYTWNAKWDTNQYVKDRSNVGDHAVMMRTDNSFRQQWWFSDGSTGGSAIAWVKKIDFDFPQNTGWMDLSLNVLRAFAVNTDKFTVASATGNTLVAGTLGVTGASTLSAVGCTSLTASAAAILQSTLAVTGGATLSSTLTLSNSTSYTGTGALLFKNGSNVVSDLVSTGNANKILGVKSNAAGYELKAFTSSDSTVTFDLATPGVIDIKTSGVFPGSVSFTGDLTVGSPAKFTVTAASGNTIIAGTLAVTGETNITSNLKINTNKFTVAAATGNTLVAGTFGVAGVTSLAAANISGNVAVNTDKFTVASATGNTLVAGTLGVTGASTLAAVGCTSLTASAAAILQSTLAVTGNLSVNTNKFNVDAATGNTTVAGTFGVTGDLAVNTNKFNVAAATGNTLVAGTLGVTGTSSLAVTNISGDVAVNTNKFNVAAATGNTLVAGTLGVAGVSTLGVVSAGATSVTTLQASTSVATPLVAIGTNFKQYEVVTALTTTAENQVILPMNDMYKSATFEIHAIASGRIQRVMMLAVQNGTSVDSVEYGSTSLGGVVATYSSGYNSGIELRATPTVENTTYRILVTATL